MKSEDEIRASIERRCERWASYRADHCCCPRCGSRDIETTTAGVMEPPDTINSAGCICGWGGKVDDLVGPGSEKNGENQESGK